MSTHTINSRLTKLHEWGSILLAGYLVFALYRLQEYSSDKRPNVARIYYYSLGRSITVIFSVTLYCTCAMSMKQKCFLSEGSIFILIPKYDALKIRCQNYLNISMLQEKMNILFKFLVNILMNKYFRNYEYL